MSKRGYNTMSDELMSFLYSVAILVIACAVFYGCEAVSESVKYANYIETEGTVTEVNAVIVKESTGDGTVSKNKFSLSYTYTVGSTEYTGALVNDTSISTGTKIKVLYNPSRPEESKGELYSIYDSYDYNEQMDSQSDLPGTYVY